MTEKERFKVNNNNNDKVNDNANVIECPCQTFGSIRDVQAALNNDDRTHTDTLIHWLEGRVDETAFREQRSLSCGGGGGGGVAGTGFSDGTGTGTRRSLRCKTRVRTSLSILNAIRDACRPFLESHVNNVHVGGASASASGSSQKEKEKEKDEAPVVYEEAFPSLGSMTTTASTTNAFTTATATTSPKKAANVLVGRKKVKPKPNANTAAATATAFVSVEGGGGGVGGGGDVGVVKQPLTISPVKPKRRIRPASIHPVAPSVWGQSAATSTFTSTSASLSGNLVNLPSEEPLMLHSRVRGPQRLVSQASSESEAHDKQTAAVTVDVDVDNNDDDQDVTNKAALVSASANTTSTTFSTPRKKPAAAAAAALLTRETKDEIAALPQLQNLIDTYCTLIRSSLVPSTALELHLLVRLLTLTQTPTPDTDVASGASEQQLSDILCSPNRCLSFGCRVLRKLAYILQGIGMPLLPELVRCRPFYAQLPELAQELELWMEKEQAARGLWSTAAAASLPVGNQTALLTLPFNQQRDSRHNYKSREDQALYKNREESRDAFLYQLRTFLSVRGKLVDAAQADKAIRKIKMSSRVVVDDVTDVNMPWFAGFFCDLLIQIGLVPLQETDKDLLNIADKDKLQKLHKRFSSKVSQTNKSSRKVVADPKHDTKAASPVEDAQQYFKNHDEFFFIFLMSADSYVFGIHLRTKLIEKLLELSANTNKKDFEKRLMDLQLVARFLGVLVFSPNWQASGADMAAHGTILSESSDGLVQLGASGLSVVDAVEKAWKSSNLVSVVPWVVEILRMATWDRLARHSLPHRRLLSLLRRIQERLNASGHDDLYQPPCRQLVILSTESLFDEVVGLTTTTLLEQADLPAHEEISDDDESSRLDCSSITFSSAILDASNSHVEELIALVSNLSRADLSALRSPGASRKLRPSIVVSPTLFFSAPVHDIGAASILAGDSATLTKDGRAVRDSLPASETSSVQSRLRDTFFHQHGELKEVCDFTVNRVLSIVTDQLPSKFIKPALSGEIGTELALSAAEDIAMETCTSFLKNNLEDSLRGTLVLLTPTTANPKVIEIALSLSVVHGLQVGKAMIKALITTEARVFQALIARDDRRRLFAGGTESVDKKVTTVINKDYLTIATDSLKRLIERLASHESFPCTLPALQDLLDVLDEWTAHIDLQIPAEGGLRLFFESILLLDRKSTGIVEWALAPSLTPTAARWTVLRAYLQIAVGLHRFSRHGLRHLRVFITEEGGLMRIITLGIAAAEVDSLSKILVEMVRSRLTRRSVLEDALLTIRSRVDDCGTVDNISHECLRLATASSPFPFDLPRLCQQLNANT